MISNRKYWEQRKAWNMYGYMQSAENNAKEIAEIYRRTNNVMCAGMDKIFDRFKSQLKLTDEQAIQLLKAADTSDVNQVIRTLNNNNNTKAYADLYKELSTPAYRYRLKLIEEQQMLIDAYMEQTYKLEKQVNTSHYRELMNQAYNKSIYDIQQMSGFGFSFSKLDDKVVKRVLNSTWSGENYSKRIWNNTSQLAKELKQEMLVSLLTGRTDKEAAKVFEYKMSAGASNARRLIRTESCYVSNEMERQAYDECEIKTYIYVATLDMRTSTICAELDGKRFPVKDMQVGVNAPPMHPWCRSTTICDISDEELANMKRRAKNPETGKPEKVPANMTYEQWHKKFVVDKEGGSNNAAEKEKLAKAGTSGKMKLKRKKGFKELKSGNSIDNNIVCNGVPVCNPKFKSGDELYRNNCGYCSATYEMRRRGYDVVANPRKPMPIFEWKSMFKDTEIKHFVMDYSGSIKKSVSKQILEAYENGARGSIYVEWKEKGAHYFSWEIDNGKIRFIDAQSGKSDASGYFKLAIPNSIRYVRWDDKEASDEIIKACKNRGG